MKKFLIFLAAVTISVFAVNDYINRFAELDIMAIKTPAQSEMKQNFLTPMKNGQKKMIDTSPRNLENSGNLYNNVIKDQQRNVLPQKKQPNPLNTK